MPPDPVVPIEVVHFYTDQWLERLSDAVQLPLLPFLEPPPLIFESRERGYNQQRLPPLMISPFFSQTVFSHF